jgi:hypothetical protein
MAISFKWKPFQKGNDFNGSSLVCGLRTHSAIGVLKTHGRAGFCRQSQLMV